MSSKKPRSRPRPKISFAVDREEIGITSEWADTFLPDSTRVKTATGANTAAVEADATEELPATDAVTATEALIATEALSATEAINAAGVIIPAEAEIATEEEDSTVDENAIVAKDATVGAVAAVALNDAAGKDSTVALNATQASDATVALSARKPRAKPLRSVADGLTPGQFIVYTQMYAKGEGEGTRFYRGGYQSLCAMTGLSKRGIQNVIGDLQAKQVVSIETAPGHNPSQVSVYRVRAEPDILKDWYAAGLRFVLGKGKVLLRQPQ